MAHTASGSGKAEQGEGKAAPPEYNEQQAQEKTEAKERTAAKTKANDNVLEEPKDKMPESVEQERSLGATRTRDSSDPSSADTEAGERIAKKARLQNESDEVELFPPPQERRKRSSESDQAQDKPSPKRVPTVEDTTARQGGGANNTAGPQLRVQPELPGRQISTDSGYSSAPDRAHSDPIRVGVVDNHYTSRFEHPRTLEFNSRLGGTNGGGKGMVNAIPESSPVNGQPSECVTGMDSPVVSDRDNNGKIGMLVVTTTPSPVRRNNGRLQMSRQISLPVPTPHIERAVRRQSSSPPAFSLDDDDDDDEDGVHNNNRFFH